MPHLHSPPTRCPTARCSPCTDQVAASPVRLLRSSPRVAQLRCINSALCPTVAAAAAAQRSSPAFAVASCSLASDAQRRMLHAKMASTAQTAAQMTDASRSGNVKRKGSWQQPPAADRRQEKQGDNSSGGIGDDDSTKQAKVSDSLLTLVTSHSTVGLLSSDDGLQRQQAAPRIISPRSAQNLAPAFSSLHSLHSTPSPSSHPIFPATPPISSSLLSLELRRLPSAATMSDAQPALPSLTSAFHSPSSSALSSSSAAAPSPIASPFLSPPLPLPPPAQLALPDLKAFEREASIEKKRRSRRRSSNVAPAFPPSSSPVLRGVASSTEPLMKRFAAPAPRERLQPPSTPMKTPVSAVRDAGITMVFRSPFVAAIAPASSIGLGELALPTPSPLSSSRGPHPLRGLQQTTPSRPLFQPIVDELSAPPLAASPPPAASLRSDPSASPSPLHPMLSSDAASPSAMQLSSFSSSSSSVLSSLLLPSPFGLPSSSASVSYFSSEFTVLSELGRGDFGVVFLCRWHADNALYAVKKSLKPLRTASQRLRACREVQHFASLLPPPSASLGSFSSPSLSSPHPNVLSYMQAWVEDAHLHIQTEYLPAGTLRDAIAAADDPIAEERIWDWTAQLLQGLSFLHSHRLIHLDIKPDNVFLTRDGGLKIGDLGTSVREGSRAGAGGGSGSEESKEEVEEGDAVYIAPELLDPSLGAVSAKADVFSLGLTLFEISADVILPTRGAAWNELRHERVDWAGSSYFLSDSPVSSASPDIRWMQTGNRAHNARAAAAGCISPIVMESAALQDERLTEPGAGALKPQRRLSTPVGRPMPSLPQSVAEGLPDAFKSPVMQPHSMQQQRAGAEAEEEQAVCTPLVRSHLRTRSTPCSSFSSPSALPLTSYDSPAVSKSSLPPLHPSQSSASFSSSADDGSHCSLPTLKRRRSSSVSVGAGAGRSAALQSLVMSLLRREPARRPTVAELLQHPAVVKAMDRRREAAQQQQRSVRVTEPRKLFDERGRLL